MIRLRVKNAVRTPETIRHVLAADRIASIVRRIKEGKPPNAEELSELARDLRFLGDDQYDMAVEIYRMLERSAVRSCVGIDGARLSVASVMAKWDRRTAMKVMPWNRQAGVWIKAAMRWKLIMGLPGTAVLDG